MPEAKLYDRTTETKQTCRSAGRSKGPRNKLTQLQPPDLWRRYEKYTLDKRQPFQQMVPGKWVKNKSMSASFTLIKTHSQWIKGFNVTLKPTDRGKHKQNTLRYRHRQGLWKRNLESTKCNPDNRQKKDCMKLRIFCTAKEEAAYRMGENSCQICIQLMT